MLIKIFKIPLTELFVKYIKLIKAKKQLLEKLIYKNKKMIFQTNK